MIPIPLEVIARTVSLLAPFEPDPSRALLAPGPDAAHTAERLTLATSPGWRLTPRQANGATIVYGHGAGSEKLLPNVPLFEAWLGAGYTVFTYALPGYDTHPDELAVDTGLRCVRAVLDAIRQQPEIDGDRIGYFGISLGAALILRAAPDVPWLKALVLFGTPLRMPAKDADLWLELLGTFNPFSAPVMNEAPSGRCAACFLNPVRFKEGGTMVIYERAFTARIDTLLVELDPLAAAAVLPPIPTRFLQGEWDALVPGEATRRIQGAIPGPSTIAWFPRRNHTTLLYDRDAAASALAWFEQHL
jgi:pimeloyl-ACP methyl ester carboxylesterase